MTVYIDADSCPSMVRDFVVEQCNSRNIPVVFAANHEIPKKENQTYSMIICSQEKDAADDYIVEKARGAEINTAKCADDLYGYSNSENTISSEEAVKAGSDIVITRDLLLAKRLVQKNTACINDRGTEFTAKNIERLLKEREEDLLYVSMGLVKHSKGSGYNKKEFAAFANSFSKLI